MFAAANPIPNHDAEAQQYIECGLPGIQPSNERWILAHTVPYSFINARTSASRKRLPSAKTCRS